MESIQICPACQTVWKDGVTCQDHFYQMLYWESEDPPLGVVHHLMVLCYHLQHPHLYSPEGATYSKGLLVDFINGVTPPESRQRSRDKVASDKRDWKITARPGHEGAHEHPLTWTMTAADVVAAGMVHYIDSVNAWAQSVYDTLKASDNLPRESSKR
jgi:hypothetical protein